jgi:hypothetical protein
LLAAVNQATPGSIIARTTTINEASDTSGMTNDMIVIIKMIDATVTLVAKTRTTRTKSPIQEER